MDALISFPLTVLSVRLMAWFNLMAIIKEPFSWWDSVWGFKKSSFRTRLVKQDIIRHGESGFTKTVQKTRIPHDPKSSSQVSIRALVSFLFDRWHGSPNLRQSTWEAAADRASMRVWNYYLSFHVSRWMTLGAPSIFPEDESEDTPVPVSDHSFFGGSCFASLSVTPGPSYYLYGVVFFRSPSSFVSPTWDMAIRFVPNVLTDPVVYTDSPVRPGSWFYSAAIFTEGGVMGPFLPCEEVVVL